MKLKPSNGQPRAAGGLLPYFNALVRLSKVDSLCLHDLYEGVLVTGGTGSGKSSTFGKMLIKALLRAKCGMLFTTTKIGDAADYAAVARACGYGDKVRVFSPENKWTTNLLEMLYNQGGSRGKGDAQGVVNGIVELLEAKNRNHGMGSGEHRFWLDAATEFCTNCIQLLACAGERISFQGIHRIIEDLPQSVDEVQSAKWQEGFINGCVDRAVARNDLTPDQQHDLRLALEYLLGRLPRADDRLRSGIVATVASLLFSFLRGNIARLCDGETNLTPEFCFTEGGIIILDLPALEFMSGQFVQMLYKFLWQKMVQKRDVNKYPTPVALFIDESQYFVAKNDLLFTSTARAARCVTVMMTQNLDVLQHQIGQSDVEGLVGNLCTKIAMSNDHVKSNEWFSRMCGESYVATASTNVSLGNSDGLSSGVQEQKRAFLEPYELVKLQKPSRDQKYADAVIFRSGRPWRASGMNHLRVRFPQDI